MWLGPRVSRQPAAPLLAAAGTETQQRCASALQRRFGPPRALLLQNARWAGRPWLSRRVGCGDILGHLLAAGPGDPAPGTSTRAASPSQAVQKAGWTVAAGAPSAEAEAEAEAHAEVGADPQVAADARDGTAPGRPHSGTRLAPE
eukprot:COSAG06_NODE_278_length_18546_cov_7.134981_13_plen_145_part_00